MNATATRIQKIGQWSNTRNRHGYDRQSVDILNSPAGMAKIEKSFSRVKAGKFNLIFLKRPKAHWIFEHGMMAKADVRENFNLEIEPEEDAITVIFTNNKAAERTPLTAWTIAHRISHVMNRGFKINELNSPLYHCLHNLLDSLYEYELQRTPYSFIGNSDPVIRNLFESLGRFRSARLKKLFRNGEFKHEVFAYYLFNNKIKFNSPPVTLLTSNRKAWGHPTGRVLRKRKDPLVERMFLDELESIFLGFFEEQIARYTGRILVM